MYCDTVSKGKAQGEHTFKGSGTGAFVMTIGTDLHGNDAVMQASTVAGGGLELTMLTLKDKAIKSEKYGSDLWSEQRQGGLAAPSGAPQDSTSGLRRRNSGCAGGGSRVAPEDAV